MKNVGAVAVGAVKVDEHIRKDKVVDGEPNICTSCAKSGRCELYRMGFIAITCQDHVRAKRKRRVKK